MRLGLAVRARALDPQRARRPDVLAAVVPHEPDLALAEADDLEGHGHAPHIPSIPIEPIAVHLAMRATKIWTWDRGLRAVDMDGEQELLAPILETVLSGCLWEELEKFPPKTVRRLLPRVIIPSNIRRLAEIWIEEREGSATRARGLAGARTRHRVAE